MKSCLLKVGAWMVAVAVIVVGPVVACADFPEDWKPVYLMFVTPQAGTCYCLSGNSRSPAPLYDLAAQRGRLQHAVLVAIQAETLLANPAYRATDALLCQIRPVVQLEAISAALEPEVTKSL
jgi:hypothetical protein